ncbi:hypothetical protein LJB87_00275 [Alistipes sp. OttesenSCG-928-L06]|nr:hypothetical protein [Alistipes sp. OttesenSCG-928-L06]
MKSKNILTLLTNSLRLLPYILLNKLGFYDFSVTGKQHYYKQRWDRKWIDKEVRHLEYHQEIEHLEYMLEKTKKNERQNGYSDRNLCFNSAFFIAIILCIITLLTALFRIKSDPVIYVSISVALAILLLVILTKFIHMNNRHEVLNQIAEELKTPNSLAYGIFIKTDETPDDVNKCIYDDEVLESLPVILGILCHYQLIRPLNLRKFCQRILSVIETKSGSYMSLTSFYNKLNEVKNNPILGEKVLNKYRNYLNQIDLTAIE